MDGRHFVNDENIPNYQGPTSHFGESHAHPGNPLQPSNCSNYSSMTVQNSNQCQISGPMPYADQRFSSPYRGEFCSATCGCSCNLCSYHRLNNSSPLPNHLYGHGHPAHGGSPNIQGPHTPPHPHTPDWVGGKNPWLMTPRHALCSANTYDPYSQLRSLQFPSLQYPPIIHHTSPICQMPPPAAPPFTISCENGNGYTTRSAPPGFQQLNPVQESHDHQTFERQPLYATNLFNQTPAEKRFEPANVDQMEVAGVFWDIENCAVPHRKSAFVLVQRIRERMFHQFREVEFMCACDSSKEKTTVIDELNSAQVTVVHIKGTAKNAADEKLRQSIRRFADEHKPPATIIIITGDVNFAPDISDFKNRRKYTVILIHPEQAPRTLMAASNQTICYSDFTVDLPLRYAPCESEFPLTVSNLPPTIPKSAVKSRLNQLFDNTGGKVSHVFGKTAVLKFTNFDMAKRAVKRFDGEDVFGHKISIREKAVSCAEDDASPRRKQTGTTESAPTYASAVGGTLNSSFKSNSRSVPLVTVRDGLPYASGDVYLSEPLPPIDGIKLTITNIDAALGVGGIRDVLQQKISKTCTIERLDVQPYNRFTMTADVIVPTMRDATNVLESCQRSRMGKKRILVTLTQQSDIRMNIFRANVGLLIQDGSPVTLSHLKRRYAEAYEDSEFCTIENLRQLGPSFVKIQEPPSSPGHWAQPCEVTLSLASPIRRRPMNQRNLPQSPFTVAIPHCDRHVQIGQPVADCSLRRVKCSLRHFAAKLHSLLASHHGVLPLSSFDICWEAEFGEFPASSDKTGVFLEHLASFVPGVEIVKSQYSYKIISWAQTGGSGDCTDTDSSSAASTAGRPRAPLGDPQMVNFGRDLTELLKECSGSSLPLSLLIKEFEKKFNRKPFRPGSSPHQQLNKLNHVVQVLGPEGRNERILTLTHRTQVKRFTQETVKILKARSDRKCFAHQYAELYREHFKVDFQLDNFGVCHLSDLLSDVPEGHLETFGDWPNQVISLPKKHRTVEEIQRTKKFGREVAELLRDCDHYSLPFTQFVPSYHHYFGRQCRLSNYGFTKLQDLFEAIPDVVCIEDDQSDKRLMLTKKERISVLSEQMKDLLRENTELTLIDLPRKYVDQYHRKLDPSWYGELSLQNLMKQLCTVVILECCARTKQPILRAVSPDNYENFNSLKHDLLRSLFDGPPLSDDNFIRIDQLQLHYENFARMKFDSQRYAKTTGLTFQQISHRALEDFIESDDRGGFHLNYMFFEARKLWHLVVAEENGLIDRKFHDKRLQLPLYLRDLQVTYMRRYPGSNPDLTRIILDKLSPVLQVRQEGMGTTISTIQTRKEFRTG